MLQPRRQRYRGARETGSGLHATAPGDTVEAICHRYRTLVLGYIHQHGYRAEDAEDLTQEFFAHLLEKRWDRQLDPRRGRLQTLLWSVLRHFLANRAASRRAGKRGGRLFRVELDENRLTSPAFPSPEDACDRAWAAATLGRALHRLEEEQQLAGHGALFRELAEFLVEPPERADYRHAALRTGLKQNTVAVHVHRLRHRMLELIREEVLRAANAGGRTRHDRVGVDRMH